MEHGWRMRENRQELKHGKSFTLRLSVKKTVFPTRTRTEVQAAQKEHAVSISDAFRIQPDKVLRNPV